MLSIRWPGIAEECGVPSAMIKAIASTFDLLA